MQSARRLGWLLALAVLVLLTGCGGGGGGAKTAVRGQVTDASGAALSGVTITVGTTSTTTIDGRYRLSISPGSSQVVHACKEGYVSTIDVVSVTSGQTMIVDFQLHEVGQSNQLVAMTTTETTATDTEGAKVILPAGSVVDGNGNPVDTATVDVTTSLPTSGIADENYTANFPGLFIGTQDGVEKAIESFGFVTVEITSGGNACQLGDEKTATLEIPIDETNDPGTDTIELWSLDENTGLWIYEGLATRDETVEPHVYRATVTHFSTYNLDRPISAPMPFNITVTNADAPAVGASVTIVSRGTTGGMWEGHGITGANGVCHFEQVPQGSVSVTAVYGDKMGKGYSYDVTDDVASMTINLATMVSKKITVVYDNNGVETPVAGAAIQAFGEGQGMGGTPFSGATASDGTVTIFLPSNMPFYMISANATIGEKSYYYGDNFTKFSDIPSKLVLIENGAGMTRKAGKR